MATIVIASVVNVDPNDTAKLALQLPVMLLAGLYVGFLFVLYSCLPSPTRQPTRFFPPTNVSNANPCKMPRLLTHEVIMKMRLKFTVALQKMNRLTGSPGWKLPKSSTISLRTRRPPYTHCAPHLKSMNGQPTGDVAFCDLGLVRFAFFFHDFYLSL